MEMKAPTPQIQHSLCNPSEPIRSNNRRAEFSAASRLAAAHGPDVRNRRNGDEHARVSLQVGRRLSGGGAPETRDLIFSFMPLSDAAPVIVAHVKGWFEAQGIQAKLRRETSWTGLRDSLNRGVAHAAQMLFGMPVAAGCGLLGHDQKPLIVPWVINRNGQAITLKKSYQGQLKDDARALREAAIAGRDAGRPLVFGHTLRIGTHAMWLRYWLAAGGIDPVQDVVLITVPPQRMVRNLRGSAMDGCCVGEPWNACAAAEGAGFTAITSQEIWPDHPEKVCAFTEDFARENPRTVVAVLKALHRAGQWLDDPANHEEASRLLAGPDHLNCDESWVRSRMSGTIEFGDEGRGSVSHRLTFAAPGANHPRQSHALWFLSQLRRWGLHFGKPDYAAISARVIRSEFYEQALEELGESEPRMPDGSETLFDGITFDPADPEGYARGFKIHNLQG